MNADGECWEALLECDGDFFVIALARSCQVVPAVLDPRQLQLFERDRPLRRRPAVPREHQAGGVQIQVRVGGLPAAAQADAVEARRHGRRVPLAHLEGPLQAEHPLPDEVWVQVAVHRVTERAEAVLEVAPVRQLADLPAPPRGPPRAAAAAADEQGENQRRVLAFAPEGDVADCIFGAAIHLP
eukprot:CAMPEP_0194743964 /NCGR_PEP_ID=MMETSP0296-20130528/100599_1 /TAXON_ID=39354 /ORGANISM="Heterosigma akashiwo, Strain CCMP2393" /LENGTH=183 /DNA_ID=CAMNT_0039656043 /DNA_START=169 /DNA_END=722 /DNA_ORIENTATION=+